MTATLPPKQQRPTGEKKQEEKSILKIVYLEDKQRREGGKSTKEMLNTLSREKYPDQAGLWEFLLVLKLETGH